jgi:hypothetical protein
MKTRIALSALTALAIAAAAPALASAQTPAPKSGNAVAAAPVSKTQEKAPEKAKTPAKHHATKAGTSHRRHKAAVTKATSATPAKTGAKAASSK